MSNLEKSIDHVPEWNRLALGNKIGAAGDRRARLDTRGGQKMGQGGVVDVSQIDERVARADPKESMSPRPSIDPRQDIVVARPPDQVRARETVARVESLFARTSFSAIAFVAG